jgi:hypothetical protein
MEHLNFSAVFLSSFTFLTHSREPIARRFYFKLEIPMSTRSLTFVYDGKSPIVCMYRQMDGYPAGMGKELAEFLAPFKIVSGLCMAETQSAIANGMSCLAAQMVRHFKSGAGSIYLVPTKKANHGQAYEYHIYEDEVSIKERGTKTALFSGTWAEFKGFCNPRH